MADIKLFEGHVESIKELRKQLADLKDAYAALASEETKDTDKMAAQLNEVAKAQDLLNDVMGQTKNAVSEADRAMAKSYDTMKIGDKTVNQLRADLKMLTAVLNDTKPGPGWDELNQKVLQVNNALKGMEQSHGDFRRSVGSYAKIFDNFEQGANEIKKAGNDIQGALGAVVGAMNLTESESDELNGALNQFRSALNVINGAKGLAGLLKNMKGWLTSTKAQTTAQKAQNAGINGFTAATQAATVAEGEATTATGLWATVLNTLPFVAIATAIALLITHFEEVTGWIENLLRKWGLLGKEEDQAKGRIEKVNQKLDERNKQLEREQKLAKARGTSNTQLLNQQKEELAQQIKMIEAEKADIQLRIQKLEAQNAWVKFWNRSNKKIKEEQENMKALDDIIKNLKEDIKDIDIDIQVENITAGKNAKASAQKALEQHNEELKKAAEAAAGEIKKIYDKTLNPAETVKQTYAEIRKKLDEGEKAELELHKDNQEEQTKITEKYSSARVQLVMQEAVETNKAYREMFNKTLSAQKSLQDVLDTFQNNERAYRKALRGIFSLEDDNQYSDQWTDLAYALQSLKKEASTIVRTVGKTSIKQMGELMQMSEEELINMYKLILADEEKFAKQYGQPFTEAIKLLGVNITEQRKTIMDQTVARVAEFREEVEKALSKGNKSGIRHSLEELMGLEEFKDNPRILNMFRKYGQQVWDEYYKGIMEGGNPLKMDGDFYNWLNEKLTSAIESAKGNLAAAREEMSMYKEGTQEYLNALKDVKDAEYELHEARMNQWTTWAEVSNKYMQSYGKATENLLGNISSYWENNIRIREADIKKQLEQGKISQKEYDAQHKRNQDSFKAMKKLQIATALISTAAAIVQALADPTVPSYYIKLANAIAAGLAGAAQVATISATDLDSSSGGGSSAPQLVDRSATVQTVGMNPADYAQAQAQQPIRAYVVDSDLKEGLDNLNNRENETTF